jgi:acyl transferase domain-containing protein
MNSISKARGKFLRSSEKRLPSCETFCSLHTIYSLVIKTGCSASLVGLHEACRALQNRDCDGAIVAGASLIMSPMSTASVSHEGVLSPDISCKTFDASANGYARGEAINAVFIKRLDDAIRDGNPIQAVIRGTGVNSDGTGQGLMTPNWKTQATLIRKVYSECGLDPDDTAYVEVSSHTRPPLHCFHAS